MHAYGSPVEQIVKVRDMMDSYEVAAMLLKKWDKVRFVSTADLMKPSGALSASSLDFTKAVEKYKQSFNVGDIGLAQAMTAFIMAEQSRSFLRQNDDRQAFERHSVNLGMMAPAVRSEYASNQAKLTS